MKKQDIQSKLNVLSMSSAEEQKLKEPLLEKLPIAHRDVCEINEEGKAVMNYTFPNHYGARVFQNKLSLPSQDNEWAIITVHKNFHAVGDQGPAIELEDWILYGNIETIINRLRAISKFKSK